MTYNTEKKQAVISYFKENRHKSISLDELCKAILKGGSGKSTVYRIVSGLVSCGMIKKFSDDKSRHITYQYIGEDSCSEHLHLKCKGCGKTIHLDSGMTKKLESSILENENFIIDDGCFIFGRCADCFKSS